MDSEINQDEQSISESIGIKLFNSHKFWAKKRLLFNILVGLAGLIPTLPFLLSLGPFDFFGIFLWGLVANGLYSLGYVADSLVITKTNGVRSLAKYQDLLFWLGTIAYVLASVFFAGTYFLVTPD